MGEVVKLRTARKRAAKREREAEADANRAFHGQSKSLRDARELERERARTLLDGARLDDEPPQSA